MKNRVIPELLTLSAGSSFYVSSSKASGPGVAFARTADQHLLAENSPVTLDAKVLFLDDVTEALTSWKADGSPLARATGTVPASSVADLATRAAAEAELGDAHEALRAAREALKTATRDELLASSRVKRAIDVVKGFRAGLESHSGFALSNGYGDGAVLAGTDRSLAERLRDALTESTSSEWVITDGCGRDGAWGDPLVAFGDGASVHVYDEALLGDLEDSIAVQRRLDDRTSSSHAEPAGLFSGFRMGPRA
jgi:hypothetical protein